MQSWQVMPKLLMVVQLCGCFTPLPAQTVIVNVSEHKKQFIDIIGDKLVQYFLSCPNPKKLVITGVEPVPTELTNGQLIPCDDLQTTHEEADVIMVNQMLHIVREDETSKLCIKPDDTDVSLC